MSRYKTFILASMFSFAVTGAWIAHAPSVGAQEKELPKPVVPVVPGLGQPPATSKSCSVGAACNFTLVDRCRRSRQG